jgi:hypothetical protein
MHAPPSRLPGVAAFLFVACLPATAALAQIPAKLPSGTIPWGPVIPEAHRAAVLEFVASGKGFAGNHGSGHNWLDWRAGLEMLGGQFNTRPFGRIQIKIDDPQSPVTATFNGRAFPFADAIYAFKAPYSREKLRVLLSVDYANSPEVRRLEERGAGAFGRQAGGLRPRGPGLRHLMDSSVGEGTGVRLLARPWRPRGRSRRNCSPP